MVDNLSPACRKLVDGIQDLLRYKEDAQLAEAILPELIKMLKCEFFRKLYQNIITFSNEPQLEPVFKLLFIMKIDYPKMI